MLRSEGKVVTSQEIANILRRSDEYKGEEDTTALVKQLCKDPDTVFVTRYQLIDRSTHAAGGWIDLIRIPGCPKMRPLNLTQAYRGCENLGELFSGSVNNM
jgi:hypothetical protein